MRREINSFATSAVTLYVDALTTMLLAPKFVISEKLSPTLLSCCNSYYEFEIFPPHGVALFDKWCLVHGVYGHAQLQFRLVEKKELY